MEQALRQLSVVREEKQPLARAIETADRHDAPAQRSDQFVHGAPAQFIGSRRHEPGWFVQRVVQPAPGKADPLSVHPNQVALGIHHLAERRADPPIDLDAPLGDERIGAAPGGDSRRGQKPVEAHFISFSAARRFLP